MERKDITDWLLGDIPIEGRLREYYGRYRRPMSEKQFFRIAGELDELSQNLNESFRNINPTVSSIAMGMLDKKEYSQFSEQLWLKCSDEVSIRKHPRYFPLLVHAHDFIEIAYVYRGTCSQTIFFDEKHSEEIRLQEGMVCILPPDLKHMISVLDESIVINILIRTDVMRQSLSNLVVGNHALFDFFVYTLYENQHPSYLLFDTHNSSIIRSLIVDMMLELCEGRNYSQKVVHLMLGMFFTYLQRDYSDTMQFSKYAATGIDNIPLILSYIHEHYRTTSVEDIAQRFCISRSYLSRMFKLHTNTTVIQILQDTRLHHACEYLRDTKFPIQILAEKVGYNDVTFFIRIFKKKYGVTPLQYRKQNQVM